MSPTSVNPGAGGARVHGISKSDAASPSRNQLPAQSNPAARSAAFILNEALALGIRVGCALDGSELVMVAPLRVPRDVRCWFETKLNEFREQIIVLIQEDVAARTGATS